MGLGLKEISGIHEPWDYGQGVLAGDVGAHSTYTEVGAVVRSAAEVGNFWDTLNAGLGAGLQIYQQREAKKAAQRAGEAERAAYARLAMERASQGPVNPFTGPHTLPPAIPPRESGGGLDPKWLMLGGAAVLAVLVLR